MTMRSNFPDIVLADALPVLDALISAVNALLTVVAAFAFKLPRELFTELLKGYIRGDGYKLGKYGVVIKSVSKRLITEFIWLCKLNNISLRYFNAAGAGFGIGEDHDPETHLIPIILKNKEIKIYGNDYNTKDGSCIRDYIHVLDLADIHLVALESLFKGISGEYNVGTGKGTSVLEIIKICEEITGMKINKIISERREGDPAELVGDVNKMYNELGWRAKYDIKDIIKSAWEWHKNNPKGFIK